jgi:hypothetical protein
MKPLALLAVSLACIVVSSGCRRSVASEKSYDLTPDKLTAAELPAAKAIVAEFISKDNVSVVAYLVRSEDATKALDLVRSGIMPGQAAKQVTYVTTIEGASGKITSPHSEDRVAWTILFTTKKATTVTVTTKGG